MKTLKKWKTAEESLAILLINNEFLYLIKKASPQRLAFFLPFLHKRSM